MEATSDDKRGARTAIVAAVLIALTGGGLYGAVTISRSVASAAVDLHAADESARAATIVRSHLALIPSGSAEQRLVSLAEARDALVALKQSLAGLERLVEAERAISLSTQFAVLAEGEMEALEARAIDQEAVDSVFSEVVTSLDELRLELITRIEVMDSTYNVVGIAIGLATAGLAPLAFFLWARSMSRRSMEVRELSLKLRHETQLREARTDVLRTVVHEFRTPLTGITGLAAVLEEPATRMKAEAGELAGMIRSEAEDMTQLTDDILVSEGLKAGRLELELGPVDVQEAVEQVLPMFHRRGVEVATSCEAGVVLADGLRLRQVIRNLISNATKYGGTEISILGQLQEDGYTLQVIDNGPGVPDGIEERLFDPYPHRGQANPSSQSVGLGLAIVKQLSLAMGGVVGYKRAGDQTIFTLTLMPFVDSPVEPGNEPLEVVWS